MLFLLLLRYCLFVVLIGEGEKMVIDHFCQTHTHTHTPTPLNTNMSFINQTPNLLATPRKSAQKWAMTIFAPYPIIICVFEMFR